mgnify:CR=1 FL=1
MLTRLSVTKKFEIFYTYIIENLELKFTKYIQC